MATTSSSSSSSSVTEPEEEAVKWEDLIPSNEQMERMLHALERELSMACKQKKETSPSPVLARARALVEQLQRFLKEKNPDARMQTAMRGLLLLRHDLLRKQRAQPFRLSEDPLERSLRDLQLSASDLARRLSTHHTHHRHHRHGPWAY